MNVLIDPKKFKNPVLTAKGEVRAKVDFSTLKTLWFNTGSLCNITCQNCYIESSPRADHFVYLMPDEVAPYLDEIEALGYGPVEIGFTGGEPCMNPDFIRLCEMALERGHRLLVLTNAMKPLMRPHVQVGILALNSRFGSQMTLRVSLDHFSHIHHDQERGQGSFDIALLGLNWLNDHGVSLSLAGRIIFCENEKDARHGYDRLIKTQGWNIDAYNPETLVLFPEMDARIDVPEITVDCWDIVGTSPENMMCSTSRMVVKRKGAQKPVVLACTLLWDDPQFEMGHDFKTARRAVQLNHPHCAKFCVLGGASCSA